MGNAGVIKWIAKGLEMVLTKRNPVPYWYLSSKDLKIYDKYKNSQDPKDKLICKLILDKVAYSRSAHCSST